MRSTLSSLWTAWSSRCVRTSACSIRPCIWRWVSIWRGRKNCWACGCRRVRGPAFWLAVFTQLQNRGLKDIFIACMDGLTGLPEAVETLYPQTRVQLCMVHMVCNSLTYVSYKHRKEVAADLKLVYGAPTEAEAQVYLDLFAEKWDRLYSSISKLWRTHWSRVIPLFAFPEDIRHP